MAVLKSRAVDIALVALLLVVGFKYTFYLENTVDIGLYDESTYLYSGLQIPYVGVPRADSTTLSAPLYALWYYAISAFFEKSIDIYYFNYKITAVLWPVFAYFFLRRNETHPIIGFLVAWILILSHINAYTWPRVSHFALVFFITTLLLTTYAQSAFSKSAIAAIGALLVSFVRPEFFISYILFSILLLFAYLSPNRILLDGKSELFCEKPSWSVDKQRILVAYLILSLILLAIFGIPIANTRSFYAFAQHYSLNWVEWHSSNLNPWTNWSEIMGLNFGSADSVLEALTRNHRAFLKHIVCNAQRFVYIYLNPLGSIVFLGNEKFDGVVSLSFVIFTICVCLKINIMDKILIMIIAIFSIPIIISVLFIYPRDHYVLPLYAFAIIIIAITLSANIRIVWLPSMKQLMVFSVIIVTVTPYFDQGSTDRHNLKTILFIQSLQIEDPVNVLAAEGDYNIYLGENFRRVAEYDKKTSFDRFIKEEDINMIIATKYLLKDTRFKNDPEFQDFLDQYSIFGYEKLDVPMTNRYLIVRKDIVINSRKR